MKLPARIKKEVNYLKDSNLQNYKLWKHLIFTQDQVSKPQNPKVLRYLKSK